MKPQPLAGLPLTREFSYPANRRRISGRRFSSSEKTGWSRKLEFSRRSLRSPHETESFLAVYRW